MAKKLQEDLNDLASYMNRIQERIDNMKIDSKEIYSDVTNREVNLQRSASSLKIEIDKIGKAIDASKKIIEHQKYIIKRMVKDFKGMAKQEQFDRLKEYLDEWGPDQLLTRKELMKNL